jgi:hypothetical protein
MQQPFPVKEEITMTNNKALHLISEALGLQYFRDAVTEIN